MNDVNLLIIDLAKEAGFTDDKYGLFWDEDANAEGVDLEKFTWKIVQYCADFIEQDQGSGHELATRLKEHFGVKESQGWVCPKCGVDRSKVSCPSGHSAAITGKCPMFGVAQGVE